MAVLNSRLLLIPRCSVITLIESLQSHLRFLFLLSQYLMCLAWVKQKAHIPIAASFRCWNRSLSSYSRLIIFDILCLWYFASDPATAILTSVMCWLFPNFLGCASMKKRGRNDKWTVYNFRRVFVNCCFGEFWSEHSITTCCKFIWLHCASWGYRSLAVRDLIIAKGPLLCVQRINALVIGSIGKGMLLSHEGIEHFKPVLLCIVQLMRAAFSS